jgi:hypothetical protein
MLSSAGDVDFSDAKYLPLRDPDKLTIITHKNRGDS